MYLIVGLCIGMLIGHIVCTYRWLADLSKDIALLNAKTDEMEIVLEVMARENKERNGG